MSTIKESIKGVISALKNDAPLTALINRRVYTKAPQRCTLPYITLKISSRPWETSDKIGMLHDLDISIYTEDDAQENLDIHAAIYNLLHRQDVPILNHANVNLEWKFGDPLGFNADGSFQTLDRYELTVIKVI